MEKATKELREGQEATVNIGELVQRGDWPDENSRPLATYICSAVAEILEQGISRATTRSCWQSVSTIRYNEERGMPKLESLVEKGTWPGKDSQPYARLLCANINRALDLLGTDLALSEGVITGEKRQFNAERDASSLDPVKPKKAARKEPKKAARKEPHSDASTSHPVKSKKVAKEKSEEIVWTVVENGTASDGFTWNKYGRKEIKGEKYKRDYYRCALMRGCPARKQMQQTDEAGGSKVAYIGPHTCKGPAHASGSGLNSGPTWTCDVTMPDYDNLGYVPAPLVCPSPSLEQQQWDSFLAGL